MIRVVRSLQKHNNFENPMISEEVQLKSDFWCGQLYTCTKLVLELPEAAHVS